MHGVWTGRKGASSIPTGEAACTGNVPKDEIAVHSKGEAGMVANASWTEFTCSVLYSMLLQPKKFILHPPYMVVNYPWRTSMLCWWYELLVPSTNVPADLAQPMLLVFLASLCTTNFEHSVTPSGVLCAMDHPLLGLHGLATQNHAEGTIAGGDHRTKCSAARL